MTNDAFADDDRAGGAAGEADDNRESCELKKIGNVHDEVPSCDLAAQVPRLGPMEIWMCAGYTSSAISLIRTTIGRIWVRPD